MPFFKSALGTALPLCFFLALPAAAQVSLSEADVLRQFGTLDVPVDTLQALEEEILLDPAPAVRGGAIRYAGPGCPFTTIQAAVEASGDGDTVRVVTGSYDERVSVFSKAINLVGGFPSCSALAPDGRSTINRGGAGLGVDIFYPAAAADPIRTVNVENFIIRGGGGIGFDSGGVLVEGRPGRLAVNFRNVQISDNRRDDSGVTGSGGGLRIVTTGDASGSAAMVTLDNDSTVIRNTAGGDGGGVHCLSTHDTGTVTLLRMGTTLVFDNEAVNGGGVAVDGCTNVFLYNGGPVILIFPAGGILGNTATENGGGIYVSNGGDVWMRAIAFSGFGDADEAALISGNSADFGGAARVEGLDSRLRVEDAYTIGNTASQGAAFSVAPGGRLEVFRRAGSSACAPVESGGGVLSRPPCSVIDGNEATTGGGAFNLLGASSGDVSRTIISNNSASLAGGPIARIANSSIYTGPATELRFEGVVMHDNLGIRGFNIAGNADVTVAYSTIADNASEEFAIAASAGQTARVDFVNSIVDAGLAMSSLAGDGTVIFNLDCVIGNLPEGATGATSASVYSQIDPEFVDQDGRNYRLQATSPAIDYCDDFNAAVFPDLDGNPRGVDWTGPPTTTPPSGVVGGLIDLGAYETPFEITNADLALRTAPPGQSSVFVNNGEQIELTMVVENQSSNIAYGPIELTGEMSLDPVFGQVWSCAAPPGVTCSPASGSGPISTTISRVAPGDQVFFFVEADPFQPNEDQEFEYSAIVTASEFNIDSNLSNNTLLLEIRSGLFADGFE